MVEVASLVWFKSSYSSGNGQCVEGARLPDGGIAVRDSKQPDVAMLRFGPCEWRVFTEGIKDTSH
jgi:hypothetical protein